MRRMNKKRYSCGIYSIEALNRAIKDYNKIAKVTCRKIGEYYECEFTRCVLEISRVMNEFDNYLLEIMNVKDEENS